LKRVLIISPYFPPSNAADMQRIRTSLPYFEQFGWDTEVVTVDERYSEMVKDPLLTQGLPAGLKIHTVEALSKTLTSKVGLGSLGLRSLWYYRKKVNRLLKAGKYDLIYFSTTQFPVCVLGAYWKKRFGVPYIIDMQDPWHSEYYQDKPKEQRPPKYWFSYRLHKYLEPIAMKQVDGLISVSAGYIKELRARYARLKDVPAGTITFGAFAPDLKIAADNQHKFEPLLQNGFINIVYVGRGGLDMHKAITPVFEALKDGLQNQPELYSKLKFYFIGTSYAPAGQGVATIAPLAKQFGVEDNVIELPGRISYYHSLATLQQADALFIPGSDDPQYSASKIYPYLLTQKPVLAIFNENSNAVAALNECADDAVVLTFDAGTDRPQDTLQPLFENWAKGIFTPIKIKQEFGNYNAQSLTAKQTELFNKVIGIVQ
jgi:hypothetical protein